MQEFLQVNLLEFFRGERSWRQFYNFLDRLPSWGHYKSQLAMDEDWARYICDREEAGLGTPPTGEDSDSITPLGYSDVIGRLDLIADRILSVRGAVQAGYSKDHEEPNYDPMPRPETALDRERERRTTSELHELDDLARGIGLPLS